MNVTLVRFGRKRRLVLIFEWLTLWPTWGPLAVSSQRRDMAKILQNCASPAGPGAGSLASAGAAGRIGGNGYQRQAFGPPQRTPFWGASHCWRNQIPLKRL